jgi:hypothetical protein
MRAVGDDSVTMEMQGASRYMRVVTPKGTSRFRITKVVGVGSRRLRGATRVTR